MGKSQGVWPVLLSVTRAVWRQRYVVVYLGLAVWFVAHVRVFYHPDSGLTSMIWFGEMFEPRRLGRLREVPIHTVDGAGYDGQFYAQIAVAGNPFDGELGAALDSPSYRARRVLLPLIAHAAGWGNDERTLTAYALGNVVAWLLLAVLLARWWFPPQDLHNLLRWGGTLFGAGLIISVARALVDGPALLLVAVGARAVEVNRRVLGAVLLGAAGLARETSVLTASALFASSEDGRWSRTGAVALAGISVLPAALWMVVLRMHFGYFGGTRNFALLTGFVDKLGELRASWQAGGFAEVQHEVWAIVSLATQVAFVLRRKRPNEIWWRIGVAFAILALALGWPVWQGKPSAASRVLLPLTLAFNVRVPRSRAGLALLLAGNLSVLSAAEAFHPLPRATESAFTGGVTALYDTAWYARETDEHRSWRWASGPAEMQLRNPGALDRTVTVAFELISVSDRTVVIQAGNMVQTVALRAQHRVPIRLAPLTLHPGTTTIRFATGEPPWPEPGPARRMLSFALYDLSVR